MCRYLMKYKLLDSAASGDQNKTSRQNLLDLLRISGETFAEVHSLWLLFANISTKVNRGTSSATLFTTRDLNLRCLVLMLR